MKETRFKVLTYAGMYVDENLLQKGIYGITKPYLYNFDDTIETLVERAKNAIEVIGYTQFPEVYYDNLRRCKLVEVSVTAVNTPHIKLEDLDLDVNVKEGKQV